MAAAVPPLLILRKALATKAGIRAVGFRVEGRCIAANCLPLFCVLTEHLKLNIKRMECGLKN